MAAAFRRTKFFRSSTPQPLCHPTIHYALPTVLIVGLQILRQPLKRPPIRVVVLPSTRIRYEILTNLPQPAARTLVRGLKKSVDLVLTLGVPAVNNRQSVRLPGPR